MLCVRRRIYERFRLRLCYFNVSFARNFLLFSLLSRLSSLWFILRFVFSLNATIHYPKISPTNHIFKVWFDFRLTKCFNADTIISGYFSQQRSLSESARTSCERRLMECVVGPTRRWLRCPSMRPKYTRQEDTSFTSAATTRRVALRAKKHAWRRTPKKWSCGSMSDM